MRKFVFFLSLWSASLAAGEFPIFIDPVVNATPPGAKVTAGYFTIVNETNKKIIITGAYSPTIPKVEIHLSSVKDDVASMKKQDSVSIEAGGKLAFEHGSYHIMLMELTKPLKDNDLVDIILSTNIGEMLIEMPVRKSGMKKDEHSGDHGNMKKDEHAGNHSDMEKDQTAGNQDDKKKDGAAHTGDTKNVN